jgi:hypothetical protein
MKSVIWTKIFVVLIDRHLVFKLLTKCNSCLHKCFSLFKSSTRCEPNKAEARREGGGMSKAKAKRGICREKMDLMLKLDLDHFIVLVHNTKKRIGYEKMDILLEIASLIYFVYDFLLFVLLFLKILYILLCF